MIRLLQKKGSKFLFWLFTLIHIGDCFFENAFAAQKEYNPQHNHDCFGPSVIDSFNPARGPEDGGTNITITGHGIPFPTGNTHGRVFCVFNETKLVQAFPTYSLEPSHSLVCTTPSHMPGYFPFSIQICGQNIKPREGPGFYEFTMASSIFSISPVLGTLSGGTVISVIGNNFVNSSDLKCRFGDEDVVANFQSSHSLECVAPSQVESEAKLMKVSNNGLDFEGVDKDVVFHYILPPKVYNVIPSTAPITGGTTVSVLGAFDTRFSAIDDIICKIGDIVVSAVKANASVISCLSPPIDIGNSTQKLIYLEVSINGGADFTNYGRTSILFHNPVVLLSIYPMLGPEYGGSVLSIYGSDIFRSDELSCDFGQVLVRAQWVSNTLIQCVSPSLIPHVAQVKLSTNGQSAGLSTNYLNYTFMNAVTITSIYPMHGSYDGGTPVTVKGTGFLNITSFFCKFGSEFVKPSIYLNSTTLVCDSPKANKTSGSVSTSVKLTPNYGHDLTLTGLMFYYEETPSIISINPKLGPKQGGTSIIVKTSCALKKKQQSMISSENDIACRFGYDLIVPGNIFNNGDISCDSPHLPWSVNNTVAVNLELTTNGVDFTSNGMQFLYHPIVSIFSVSPQSGSENGGTLVTLVGANILRSETLSCYFGDELSSSVQWISSSSIKCMSPPSKLGYHKEPVVQVRVSLNGQKIHYYQSIPFFYQPSAHISNIEPKYGSILGDYKIHIFGGGFSTVEGIKVMCRFGEDMIKYGSILNDTHTTCVAPSISLARKIELSLSFNEGHDYISSDSAVFQYTEPALIEEMYPKVLPQYGGVKVTLKGKNLIENKYVTPILIAGGAQVTLMSYNRTAITFIAPAIQREHNSSIDISLSKNDGFEFDRNNLRIGYVPSPKITEVIPPFSHELGGMKMIVLGTDFFYTPDLSCIIRCTKGNTLCGRSDAFFISSNEIHCEVPESKCDFNIAFIELSSTKETNPNNPTVSFQYEPLLSTTSIYPRSGPISGGTRLSVVGTFASTQTLACTFWSKGEKVRFVIATKKSSSELGCVAPPSIENETIQTSFSITTMYKEEIYYSGDIPDVFFEYEDGIFLLSLTPQSGPTHGGTEVHILGSNFIDSSDLCCRFLIAQKRTKSFAKYFNKDHISCVVPAIQTEQRNVSILSLVDVSINGVDFSKSQGTFLYHPPEEILKISPEIVSEGIDTNITIKGSNFMPYDGLSCKFEMLHKHFLTEPASFLSSNLLKCRVRGFAPGKYRVSVSNNGADFILSDYSIEVHAPIEMLGLEPSGGKVDGGTRVVVKGNNMFNTSSLSCKFGNSVTAGIFLSKKKILCYSPRSFLSSVRKVHFSLSMNGRDFVDSGGLNYFYSKSPEILDFFPASGPFEGGTQVTLTMNHLDVQYPQNFTCVFGSTKVQAVLTSKSSVSCISPRFDKNANSLVNFEFSNGFEQTQSSFLFKYQDLPYLTEVHPSNGVESGENIVKIFGTRFRYSVQTACSFGNTAVPALTATFNCIECLAPPSRSPGPVKLEVTLNGQDWTTQGMLYTYTPLASVWKIYPNRGPIIGGTRISVHGLNFIPPLLSSDTTYMCSFNGVLSSAIVVSDILITCISPPTQREAKAKFKLICAKSKSSIIEYRDELIFEYFSPIFITSIEPSYGNIEGGSPLQIFGSKIDDYAIVLCRFEIVGHDIDIMTVIYSRSIAVCITPNSTFFSSEHEVASIITLVDGSGFRISSNSVPFLFKKSPIISEVSPCFSDAKSASLVTINAIPGSGWWVNSHSIFCQFGNKKSKGIWISSLQIKCMTPIFNGALPSNVTISVTDNNMDYGNNMKQFTILDSLSVLSFSPLYGSFSFGTEVIIRGFGFFANSQAACLFGNNKVFGHVINEYSMKCRVPLRHESGLVVLQVSNNGVNYVKAPIDFEYVLSPSVSTLFPQSGHSGQLVTVNIVGMNFIQRSDKAPFCAVNGDPRYSSTATILSPTTMKCTVMCPTYALLDGQMSIEVSVNGGDYYSSSKIPFFCDPQPITFNMSPEIVTSGEKTLLTIYGSGFRHRIGLSCAFSGLSGLHITKAIYQDRTEIKCHAPPWKLPQIITVDTSNNGITFSESSNLFLDILNKVTVHSVYPRVALSGASVIVKGTSFMKTDSVSCKVGKSLSEKVIILNETMAICHLATNTEANNEAPVSISIDGRFYSRITRNTQIQVQAMPIIESAYPLIGLTSGGTVILIKGENLNNSRCMCVLGGNIYEPEFQSETKVLCVSPAVSSPRKIPLQLNIGSGTNMTLDISSFLYFKPLLIRKILPDSGPLYGGTTILVNGKFDSNLPKFACAFGRTYVNAKLLSNKLLTCVSPAGQTPGTQSVSLVLKHSNFSNAEISLSNSNFFLYYDPPILVALNPKSGPIIGGTNVNFLLDGLFVDKKIQTSRVFCKFGEKIIQGSLVINASSAVCKSPSSKDPESGNVSVAISFNGVDFPEGNLTFHYNHHIEFHSMLPKFGPISGGTPVMVDGTSFIQSTDIRCRFGQNIHTPGIFRSSKQILCYTIETKIPYKARLYIKFDSDHDWFDSGLIFFYHRPIKLLDSFPRIISQHGHKFVHLLGTGFQSEISYFCSFGDEKIISSGHFLSNSMISCVLPTMTAQTVESKSIAVTTNFIDFFYSPFTLIHERNFNILSISPLLGPSFGGTNITILGNGFLDTAIYRCWFGETAVKAVFVSHKSLNCLASSYLFNSPMAMMEVRVSQITPTSTSETLALNKLRFVQYDESDFSIKPTSGPTSGNTIVEICGLEHLIASLKRENIPMKIEVLFNSRRVKTRIMNFVIQFFSPENNIGPEFKQEVNISFSLNGGVNFSRNLVYTYYTPPELLALEPSLISQDGGVDIIIIGRNFPQKDESKCSFDGIISKAHIVSNNKVRCHLPEWQKKSYSRFISVAFSSNGQDFGNKNLILTVQVDTKIESINPLYTSESGGSVITMKGYNLPFRNNILYVQLSSAKSNFVSRVVNAKFLDETTCTFLAPRKFYEEEEADVSISISIDGYSFFETGFDLNYFKPFRLLSIFPKRGSIYGEYITIVGENFLQLDGLSCVVTFIPGLHGGPMNGYLISQSINATVFNQTTISCELPSIINSPFQHDGGVAVQVQLSQHDASLSSDKLSFVYSDVHALISAVPDNVPETGNLELIIVGDGFDEWSTHFCVFLDITGTKYQSEARLISGTEIKCLTPSLRLGKAQVHVINENSSTLGNGLQLAVRPSRKVMKMNPIMGPINGGTKVNINGIHFISISPGDDGASRIYCKFNEEFTPALIISDSLLQCDSPNIGKDINVAVTVMHRVNAGVKDLFYNFDDFNSSLRFKFSSIPIVQTIHPIHASAVDGTTIWIHGYGFSTNSRDLSIKLISYDKPAIEVNTTILEVDYNRIVAEVPASPDGVGLYKILATSNSFDFSDKFPPFRYVSPFSIYSVKPNIVPELTAVQLYVQTNISENHLSQKPRCKIGVIESPAVWQEKKKLKCRTPANLTVGLYFINIALNEYDYMLSNISLSVRPSMSVLHAYPLNGPSRGGTVVTIVGNGFDSSFQLLCAFGLIQPVQALFIDKTHIECISPYHDLVDHKKSGRLVVDLKVYLESFYRDRENERSTDNLDPGLAFEYYQNEQINLIEPRFVPYDGRSILLITGKGFLDSGNLSCRIGVAKPILAVFLSSALISCVTPKASDALLYPQRKTGRESVRVTVQVANNGVDFESSAIYAYGSVHYFATPSISQIYPTNGRMEGGTKVTIHVDNLHPSDKLCCSFSSHIVKAEYISPNSLSCISPKRQDNEFKNVHVRISLNEKDFSSNFLLFNYVSFPIVEKILPTHGSIKGGNKIIAYGSNFHTNEDEDIFCHFNDVSIKALSRTSEKVVCIAPPHQRGPTLFDIARINFVTNQHNHGGSHDKMIEYTYMNEIKIESLSPSAGSELGGTNITIEGSFFPSEVSLYCLFDKIAIIAHTLSDKLLHCKSPKKMENMTSIINLHIGIESGIENEPAILTAFAIQFAYTKPAFIERTFPHRYFIDDNTFVYVKGGNFVSMSKKNDIRCRFGIAGESPGEILSEKLIRCSTPSNSRLKLQKEVQEVSIFSQAPQREVQLIKTASPPLGFEVQMITIEAFGFDRDAIAQTLRLLIQSETSMSGTFALSYKGRKTLPIPIDASALVLEEYLQNKIFSEVSVVSVPNPGVTGDSSVWDITIDCAAGGINQLELKCDSTNIKSVWSGNIRCEIIQLKESNSSKLDGEFSLAFNGKQTGLMDYNISNLDLWKEVDGLIDENIVSVKKMDWPVNFSHKTGFAWLITFHRPYNDKSSRNDPYDWPELSGNDQNLRGTRKKLTVKEIKKGSSVNGVFSISMVGENDKSKVLPFNATSIAVQSALESFAGIEKVQVSRYVTKTGVYSWKCTFSSFVGSPGIITVNDTHIKGNNVHIEVIRIAEGSIPVGGFFFLSFRGEKSRRLSVNSSVDELRSAIRSLRTVDDVVVSHEKKITEINKDREGWKYSITFTSSNSPENLGPLPLIEAHDSLLTGTLASIVVTKKQSACCSLDVTLNGKDFFGSIDGSIIPFGFIERPIILSIYPIHGSVFGGTKVTLIGIGLVPLNLDDSKSVFCVFGASKIEGTFINDTIIECITPPNKREQVSVNLHYLDDKVSFKASAESKAIFEFVPEMKVNTTFPHMIPIVGKGPLDIIGNDFMNSSELKCRFKYGLYVSSLELEKREALLEVGLIYHSSTHLQCSDTPTLAEFFSSSRNDWTKTSVASNQSFVLLEITANGVDWVQFEYLEFIPLHEIYSLTPSFGPISGNTSVTISGRNFVNSRSLSCKFGSFPLVQATFISETKLQCISPQMINETDIFRIPLAVSNNGYHFSSDSPSFGVYENVILQNIKPNVGPSTGGTSAIITIGISSFLNRNISNHFHNIFNSTSSIEQSAKCGYSKCIPLCKFNTTIKSAHFIEVNQITCQTPRSESSNHVTTVSISLNGGHNWEENMVLFHYYPIAEDLELSLYPKSGPIAGGTLVKITGLTHSKHPFHSAIVPLASSILCKFGDHIFPSSAITEDGNVVICRSPAAKIVNETSSVSVDISLNGDLSGFSSCGLYFRYDVIAYIKTIIPSFGSVLGGTSVKVLGGPFKNNHSNYQCRFGDKVKNAAWMNEEEIKCVSPDLGKIDEVQTVSLFSMAWVPEIQTIESYADDYLSEIHTIFTSGPKYSNNEIQKVSIKVEDEDEIQRLETRLDFTEDIEIEVELSLDPTKPEVQKVSFQYESSTPEIQSVSIIPFSKKCESGFIEEIQIVSIKSSDLTNAPGTFDLHVGEQLLGDLSVGYSPTLLTQLFNQILNIPVEITIEDKENIRNWIITFDGSLGDVEELQVRNFDDSILDVDVHTRQDGSVQEIQEIKITSMSPGQYWRLSLDGSEWTGHLNHDETPDQLALAISRLSSTNVTVTSTSFFNISHSFMVTFVDYIGDVPMLISTWSSNSANIVIREYRRGTSAFKGNFTLSIKGQETKELTLKSTAHEIETALINLKLATTFKVTRVVPMLRNEIVFIITFLMPGDNEMFDIHWKSEKDTCQVSKVNRLKKGSIFDGEFELYISTKSNFGEESKRSTGFLSFDVDLNVLRDALRSLDMSWTGIEVSELPSTSTDEIISKSWLITFPQNLGDIDMLQTNTIGFIDKTINSTIKVVQDGRDSEIQTISIDASNSVEGAFTLSFKGYETNQIPWNASALHLKECIEELPTIGTVLVERKQELFRHSKNPSKDIIVPENSDSLDYFTLYSWDITFLSYVGDAPSLEVCCDSHTFNRLQTISSSGESNVALQVIESQKGSGSALAGYFQIFVENFVSGIQTSDDIPINATEEEVDTIIRKMPMSQFWDDIRVSRIVSDPVNQGFCFRICFSGLHISKVSFEARKSYKIKVNTFLKGSYSIANIKISPDHWISKEIQVIQYFGSDQNQVLTCSDGTNEGRFSFSRYSDSESVARIISSLTNLKTKVANYGDVLVSRSTSQNSTCWTVTFLEIVGNPGQLTCSEDVKTLTLSNGTSTPISDGTFTLMFCGFETKPISYNATAVDIKHALEEIQIIGIDGVQVSSENSSFASRNGEMIWAITFSGRKVEGDIPLLSTKSNNLGGSKSSILLTEVRKGSHISGFFRLNMKDKWSNPISVQAKASAIENTLKEMEGIDFVNVAMSEDDGNNGELSFCITFPHYIGYPPYGFVPKVAGNQPSIIIDGTNLLGGNIKTLVHTIQNGTDPITDDQHNRGFRLVASGGSKSYPLSRVTRWLHYNETATTMLDALEGTGALPYGFQVNRRGPYFDGSYCWDVIFPKGYSWGGETFWAVRHGGGSIKLQGIQATVSCNLTRIGTQKLSGKFRLLFKRGSSYVEEKSEILNHNATSIEIKKALENMSSITEVNVNSRSTDFNHSGNERKRWDVTFVSLKDAGDMPLLRSEIRGEGFALSGSSASVEVYENRRGQSNTIQKLSLPQNISSFELIYDDKSSYKLNTDSSDTDIEKAVNHIYNGGVVSERRENRTHIELIFLFTDVSRTNSMLIANVYSYCGKKKVCLKKSKAELLVRANIPDLEGTFSLGLSHHCGINQTDENYHSRSKTSPISVFAKPSQVEKELESIQSIDDVIVKVTESNYLHEHKIPVLSGRVGVCRNFHVHFRKTNLISCQSLDLPLLSIDSSNVKGVPTKDSALMPEYFTKITKVVKGAHKKLGGTVNFEISVNRADFSSTGFSFQYLPTLETKSIYPVHGEFEFNFFIEEHHNA